MKRILIIDDDPDIRILLAKFLTKEGYQTEEASNGKQAIISLKANAYDLVLCDFKLPDENGLDLLRKIKIIDSETKVIMITGYSDVKVAVQAMRLGAVDYVTKPLYPDEFLHLVNQTLRSKEKPKKSRKLETKYVQGISNQARLVEKHIGLIAPTDMSVVILGETGTGKEYVARAIHENSKRKNKPFVAVDCGALPKELAGSELFGHVKGSFTGAISDKQGSFEFANGGTLFLDEIGNLSYENQIKLLRVLQEKKIKKLGSNHETKVDVRVLAATNEDLSMGVKKGEFREDLFYRFNEFQIQLTPLRERKSDITVYCEHFLNLANITLEKKVHSLSETAAEKIKNYYWHGNLRELKNVIKRAVLLCQSDTITEDCLPIEIINPTYYKTPDTPLQNPGEPVNLKSVAEIAERDAIIDILEKTGNNKTRTADILNIDRKTLYNKLKAYNISL